jgi:hypothetical protein
VTGIFRYRVDRLEGTECASNKPKTYVRVDRFERELGATGNSWHLLGSMESATRSVTGYGYVRARASVPEPRGPLGSEVPPRSSASLSRHRRAWSEDAQVQLYNRSDTRLKWVCGMGRNGGGAPLDEAEMLYAGPTA